MKKITSIIIDDHLGSIQTLRADLSSCEDINLVETCTSLSKGKEAVLNYRPDLLFLDVEMPKMSGLEFLEDIQTQISWTMFTVIYSAFEHYSIPAMRLSAFDFLLKPYRQTELETVLCRVRSQLIEPTTQQLPQTSFANLYRKIAIQTVSGIIQFDKDEVLYFKYDEQQWHAILKNDKRHALRPSVVCCNIVGLSDAYILVNPHYIINLNHVALIENRSYRCQFYPPYDDFADEILISRRNYQKIKTMLNLL
jgi:two-component system LytT family response regulator